LENLLTGEQIRAARALVRIDQTELARRSGLSVETIKRLEATRGRIDAHVRTAAAVRAAFDELGVRLRRLDNGMLEVSLAPADKA
jgi:transcriptional regulator with XRE-family HTH domain